MSDEADAIKEIIGLRLCRTYYGQECLKAGTKAIDLATEILGDLEARGYEVKLKPGDRDV